jgi:gas vesicle protein
MATVNFSNLQASSSATPNSQVLVRLDNSLSGAAGFSRVSVLNFEKSLNVYSTVNSNSATTWNYQGSDIKALTGNWQNTYTNFSSQSANNLSVYNTVRTNSATTWNYQGSDIKALTGNWQNTYIVYATSSAALESLFSTVQTNSATRWNYQGTDIKALTGNWQNTYTGFSSQSANNISVYNSFNSNSSNYNSVYNTFNSQSANNLSVYNTVQTNSASNWRPLTLFAQVSSSSITSPNSAIPVHGLSAISLSSSVDFALIPALSGALLAQIPDNTITNGRKRGLYATDWQRVRTDSTQVASGNYSTIGGGISNTASGNFSTVGGGDSNRATGLYSTVAGGGLNVASGTYSVAHGNRANTRLHGQYSHAAGLFTTTGDAQYVRFILRNTSVSDTPTLLYLNGSSSLISLQQGYTYSLNFKILGSSIDGSTVAEYNKRVVVKYVGVSTEIVNQVDITTPYDSGTSATILGGSAGVDIYVVGPTVGPSWRWVAVVDGIEMKYS